MLRGFTHFSAFILLAVGLTFGNATPGVAQNLMTQCKTPEDLLDLPKEICLALSDGASMEYCQETTLRVLAEAFAEPTATTSPSASSETASEAVTPTVVVTIAPATIAPSPTIAIIPTVTPPPTATAISTYTSIPVITTIPVDTGTEPYRYPKVPRL